MEQWRQFLLRHTPSTTALYPLYPVLLPGQQKLQPYIRWIKRERGSGKKRRRGRRCPPKSRPSRDGGIWNLINHVDPVDHSWEQDSLASIRILHEMANNDISAERFELDVKHITVPSLKMEHPAGRAMTSGRPSEQRPQQRDQHDSNKCLFLRIPSYVFLPLQSCRSGGREKKNWSLPFVQHGSSRRARSDQDLLHLLSRWRLHTESRYKDTQMDIPDWRGKKKLFSSLSLFLSWPLRAVCSLRPLFTRPARLGVGVTWPRNQGII